MRLYIRNKENNEVIAALTTNRRMTQEEVCEACGIELAITQEDYDGMPENGKYDIECLDFTSAPPEVTRSWKVYGAAGHRQRESFNESQSYDWTMGEDVRRIEIENADKTGTNEYTIIRITRNTSGECEDELRGQITDGLFENCRVGDVVEI